MQAARPVAHEGGAAQERIEGLTAWRALLMLLGLPLHAVIGDAIYPPFAAIALISGSFRMGAFFMISGLLNGFALGRHASPSRWLRRRLGQLGVPTLVGLLVISPVVSLILGKPALLWPLDPYHIWFLVGLLAYTLVAAAIHRIDMGWPIFAVVERRSREARRLQGVMLLLTGLASFTLMAVGAMIHVRTAAALHPMSSNLPLILGYMPTFLLGFAAARAPTSRRMLTASQRVPLAVLATAIGAHLLLRSPWLPAAIADHSRWWIDMTTMAGNAWCPPAATVIILRSAMAIRQVPPLLGRLADASFTMYLLHYPIIVTTKVALRPLDQNPWVDFVIAMLVGGTLSYAIHRRVVMPVPALSLLLAGRSLPMRTGSTSGDVVPIAANNHRAIGEEARELPLSGALRSADITGHAVGADRAVLG